MKDLFIMNIQLFSSQDVDWWTGVAWICGAMDWYQNQKIVIHYCIYYIGQLLIIA